MYRINIDDINKIICIELSESMSWKEINNFIVDINNLVIMFPQKQYKVLVMTQRLDPLSQDNIPVFQQAVEIALKWAKEIVIVKGNRTVTRMQLSRIESEAIKITNSSTPITRFQYINEAVNYLNRN